MAPSTAASRSASAKTMLGLLPPSSRVTRLSVSAAFFMMIWPTSVEPVKAILSTPRWATSGVAGGLAEAGDDVDHAGGEPGLHGQLAHAQGGERGLLGRLEHDGAAGGQRGAPLPGDHQHREVPGDDLPGDAHRLAAGVAEVPAADRDRLAVDLVGPAGVVAEAVDHQRQVGMAALADRLAVVQGLELGQLVDVRFDQVGELVHQPPAVAGVGLAPGARVKRLPRRLDGAVDVGGVALGDLGDDLLGRRVDRGERLAAVAVDPLAVDQQLGLDRASNLASRSSRSGHDLFSL